MTEALLTIVNVKSEGSFSYPETMILHIEFDSSRGAELLVEDLINDANDKVGGGKYGIAKIEDIRNG